MHSRLIPPALSPKNAQVSSIGIIPKSNQLEKCRRIMDISNPEGNRLNEGFASELCSLQYLWVDDVVHQTVGFSQETSMVKMHIESAY